MSPLSALYSLYYLYLPRFLFIFLLLQFQHVLLPFPYLLHWVKVVIIFLFLFGPIYSFLGIVLNRRVHIPSLQRQ